MSYEKVRLDDHLTILMAATVWGILHCLPMWYQQLLWHWHMRCPPHYSHDSNNWDILHCRTMCYQPYYDTGIWDVFLTILMTTTIGVSSSCYTWHTDELSLIHPSYATDFHLIILNFSWCCKVKSSSPSWHFQMKCHSYPTPWILTLSTTVYNRCPYAGDIFTFKTALQCT